MKKIAEALLTTGSVKLQVENHFTFVSGIKSPIYCDNRKLLGYVERDWVIEGYLKELEGLNFDVVVGTATAGIPWASFIADRVKKPLSYVRSKPKEYGAGNQIEGADVKDKSVILIEDLISTGGSSIKAAEALLEAGAKEVVVMAIFTYEFEEATVKFKQAGLKYTALSNFSTLIALAKESGYISNSEYELAKSWNSAPKAWKNEGKNN